MVAIGLLRPTDGAVHALAGVLMGDRIFGTLVEHHANVAAEGQLHVDRRFGGEGVQIAVEVGLEDHALVGNFAEAAEAEDLEAAGIGEDGVGPRHEAVKSAHFADELVAGAEEEMVGVGQQDFDAEIFGEVALGESFDGGLGADRHEYGGFDGDMGGVKESRARAGFGALGY
jgi:hypothetical protein